MTKTLIGICDPDREYAERFAYYSWHSLGDRCEAVAYTKPDRLKAMLTAAGVDILIMTEDFLDSMEEEEAKSCFLAVRTAVLLTETEKASHEGVLCCYKYRSTEKLLNIILSEHQIRQAAYRASQEGVARKIAVFSPVRRCGKTSLALTLCSALEQAGSVLFLSFEVLNAHFKGDKAAVSASDLLYRTMLDRDPAAFFREDGSGRGQLQIGPVRTAEDLSGAGAPVLGSLIDALAHSGACSFLVTDLGDIVLPSGPVFSRFDRIWIPYIDDDISRKKMKLWEESLAKEEAIWIGEKGRRIDMTFFCDSRNREEASQELEALAGRLVLEDI